MKSNSIVSIVAAKMVTPTLAKVAISYTGKPSKQDVESAVSSLLKHGGSIVDASFVDAEVEGYPNVAIGFVRANREVRLPTDGEIRASYKVMSSNILMSKEDSSLWEIKKNKGTTYLARKGFDNLEDLVNLATAKVHTVSSITATVTASIQPEKHDFVSFINSSGDTDYGFVVKAGTTRSVVVAVSSKEAVKVDNNVIIDSHEFKIDPITAKIIRKNLMMATTADGSLDDMIAYYKTLYSYDDDYMNDVINQVKEVQRRIA